MSDQLLESSLQLTTFQPGFFFSAFNIAWAAVGLVNLEMDTVLWFKRVLQFSTVWRGDSTATRAPAESVRQIVKVANDINLVAKEVFFI